ncbi:esterase-like activity of phytase family protein [Microbulbifer spongiae]|uniref:Esterase-like activity of phytase family protein n=1 Tax=Microbulbifer spongiae TaxID=2944933 RepID=A0ABY9EFT6_9GAMM|nr:esterase-like activity of phytase family protein [Microbulbifer sp. MI-G]WKD50464.1 esterase-like activity of phytase family protein [Microbulbifer sp. MI-G]
MIERVYAVVGGVLLSSLGLAAEISSAKLLASYWVDGSEGLGLSGLSFCNGQLLTVSDKKSDTIYTLELENKRAKAVPYLEISGLRPPKKDKPTNLWYFFLDLTRRPSAMDFEGISCKNNAIYILSERFNRIAKVDKQGKAHWLETNWSLEAKTQGYLQGFNLSSEGIVKVEDDFWVALESEPRGLVKLASNGSIQIFQLPPVDGLKFQGGSEDLTALDYFNGALFTLERNAHAVCKRALPNLQAEWCLDYRALELSPELGYEGTRTGGMGDGLAVREQGIFVLFDNSNISRIQDPKDRRALLLQLAFPEGTR